MLLDAEAGLARFEARFFGDLRFREEVRIDPGTAFARFGYRINPTMRVEIVVRAPEETVVVVPRSVALGEDLISRALGAARDRARRDPGYCEAVCADPRRLVEECGYPDPGGAIRVLWDEPGRSHIVVGPDPLAGSWERHLDPALSEVSNWSLVVRSSAADEGSSAKLALAPGLMVERGSGKGGEREPVTWIGAGAKECVVAGEGARRVLLALQEGSLDRGVVESLFDAAPAVVSRLAYRGIVVAGDDSPDPSVARRWFGIGVTPSVAGALCTQVRCTVSGDGAKAVRDELSGWGLVAQAPAFDADLAIRIGRHGWTDGLIRHGREIRAIGRRFLPVTPHPGGWLLGPVFDADGGCVDCLLARLEEVPRQRFRNWSGMARGPGRHVSDTGPDGVVVAALSRFVCESVAGLVARGTARLVRAGVESDHRLVPRPQCERCGAPRVVLVNRTERAPVFSAEQAAGIEGVVGFWNRFRAHADPVFGSAGEVRRIGFAFDPDAAWFHRAIAAAVPRGFSRVRGPLRTRLLASGKGARFEAARAGALAEAIERLSCRFRPCEDVVRNASFDELLAEREAPLRPNDVERYSERQYADRDVINSKGYQNYSVPFPFEKSDEERMLRWTRLWSASGGSCRWALVTSVFFPVPQDVPGRGSYGYGNSNGVAAGPSVLDALARGFCELVERDAFSLWWYARAVRPEVDLESFGDPWLGEAKARFASAGRELWVLDVTTTPELPAMVAVARRVTGDEDDVLIGAGCSVTGRAAAKRAVCEAVQFLPVRRGSLRVGSDVAGEDAALWRSLRCEDAPWLSPSGGGAHRTAEDYPGGDGLAGEGFFDRCQAAAERLGVLIYAAELTRPDCGLPVMRAVAPGLRHFWPRFGSGRLYDAPLSLGWIAEPFCEDDVNPVLPLL